VLQKLALVAGLSLVMCGDARAEPAFAAFQRFCVAHHAARAPALADAEAAGWIKAPEFILDNMSVGHDEKVDGRMSPDSASSLMLLVGRQSKMLGRPVRADSCSVATGPSDGEQMRAAARKFAGVAPTRAPVADLPDQFIWRDQSGKHVPTALAGEEMIAPDVQMLVVYGDKRSTVVTLVVPREVSPN
jgi:hypothetical protein